MNPKVSIIIPVYNGSNYVAEAIESALAQTYNNIEIIVVNDGSRDNGATDNAVKPYLDKIRYIKKENGGVSSALNEGIRQMTGEYFSWLSHDDLYTPEKVSSQIYALEASGGNNILIMTDSDFINASGKKIIRPKIHTVLWPENKKMSMLEIVDIVFAGTSIGGCTLLIPRSAFDKAGLFNEDYRYMQDMDMWYRIFLNGFNLLYINNIGVHSRVHSGQLTVSGNNIGKKDAQIIGRNLINQLLRINAYDQLKNYACLCFRNQMWENGDYIISSIKKCTKLSVKYKCRLFKYRIYGHIRPIIRTIYYKFLWNINIKNA